MKTKNTLADEIYRVVKNFCEDDEIPTRGLKDIVLRGVNEPDSLDQGELFLIWDALGVYAHRTPQMEEIYEVIGKKWADMVIKAY